MADWVSCGFGENYNWFLMENFWIFETIPKTIGFYWDVCFEARPEMKTCN